MSDPQASSPYRSGFRIRHVVYLILVLILSLFAVARWWISNDIDRRLAAVTEAGEPTTLDELQAWYPEPPMSENASLVYEKAFAKWRPVDKDLAERAQTGLLTDEDWPLVKETLDENEDVLRLLYEAAGLNIPAFPRT